MANKEFIQLFEENIFILHRLSERLKIDSDSLFGYSRQQIGALMRLHIGGRAMLKDIARREFTTTPNLCAAFRKLEQDGLVRRDIDENDRRNTWYSVTPSGAELTRRVMGEVRAGIATMFSGLSAADEAKLTSALKTMNELFKNMEITNA